MQSLSAIPVLHIESHRLLHDGRLCARGPVYGVSYRDWLRDADEEVRVLLKTTANMCVLHANFENPFVIEPNELFGFDPISEEYRFLRAEQNYSCVPLAGNGLPEDIRGAVVVPNTLQVFRYEHTVRISLDLDESVNSPFLDDAKAAPRDKHLVWRYEGVQSGFLVVPASTVAMRGVLDVDCTVIAEPRSVVAMDAGAEIYGFLRMSDPTTLEATRVERQLGKIICLVA